jgi:hypothetical protein
MKTITFTHKDKNLFHLIKESNLIPQGQVLRGEARITGVSNEDISVGDTLLIIGVNYQVTNVVERRDHKGVFLNPEDNKDSFFEVQTKFERVIETKK